jgi:hypothetical protein
LQPNALSLAAGEATVRENSAAIDRSISIETTSLLGGQWSFGLAARLRWPRSMIAKTQSVQ